MVNPKLYSETNALTKAAAIQCLQEYMPKLKWTSNGERIIDLGCGDGSVTCEILKKLVPHNYDDFYTCDLDEGMINHAKKRYRDENITFRVLDLVGEVPEELKCGFTHVFSFFALHWVEDQEKAFRNIYDIMSVGGECVLTIAGYNPITYLYDAISKDKSMKWSSVWIKDLSTFVSAQYLYMQDGEKFITDLLQKIGFTNIDVQFKKMNFVFDNIVGLKNLIKAVQPYNMPDDVFEDFFTDFVTLGKKKNIFDKSVNDVNDIEKKVDYDYEMFIVYARKG